MLLPERRWRGWKMAPGDCLIVTGRLPSLRQLLQQRFRFLQVPRLEAFSKTPVNRSRQVASLLHLALTRERATPSRRGVPRMCGATLGCPGSALHSVAEREEKEREVAEHSKSIVVRRDGRRSLWYGPEWRIRPIFKAQVYAFGAVSWAGRRLSRTWPTQNRLCMNSPPAHAGE